MIDSELFLLVAAFLLVNLLVGLMPMIRGPTRANRLLSAQLLGTTTAAVLLLLAEAMAMPALRDVALVFVLLAAVLSIAFVRLVPPPKGPGR